jgi:hypothetical protein
MCRARRGDSPFKHGRLLKNDTQVQSFDRIRGARDTWLDLCDGVALWEICADMYAVSAVRNPGQCLVPTVSQITHEIDQYSQRARVL